MATPDTQRTPQPRFKPGDEQRAEQWLAQEPSAIRLSSWDLLVSPFPFFAAVPIVTVTVLVVTWAVGVYPDELAPDIALMMLIGNIVFYLVCKLLYQMYNQGPFSVSADAPEIRVRGDVVATLDEIGVPRVVPNYKCTFESLDEDEIFRGPVVMCDRGDEPPFVFFNRPTSRRIRKRIPEFADRLNTIIAEYDERKATRAWLEQRYRELEAPRPYRREGESP